MERAKKAQRRSFQVIGNIKKFILPAKAPSQELLLEFKQQYMQTRDFIRGSIYWMVRSDATDDLVQETYVKAWKNYENFRKNSSFKTWIYRIAMNVTYDYLRKSNTMTIDSNSDKIHVSDTNEVKDLITQGLSLLSEVQREVFILFYKYEYTTMEISALLDIPEGTVKSRLSHSRSIFQKFLETNGVKNG